MAKFLLVFLLPSIFFNTYAHDSEKIAELENRIKNLERVMKKTQGSGIKTVNYENKEISNSPASSPDSSPGSKKDVEMLKKQVNEIQKRKKERDKYLEELMND